MGQSSNMGLGLYASGQIHIDTQGYRTWGTLISPVIAQCVIFNTHIQFKRDQ